jgi:hypothetical protein
VIHRAGSKRRALQIHKALRKELSPQDADEIEQEGLDSEQAGTAAVGAGKFALSLTYHALCDEPPSAERDALLALFDFRPTVAWCSVRTRTVYYSCAPAKWNPLLGLDRDALQACLSRALARIKANDRVEAVALDELHFQIEAAQARQRQEEAPVLQAGETNLAMLEDARCRRWGDSPGARLKKVQQYFDELRRKYPRVEFGINRSMAEAARACGVSLSYIKKQRRPGLLIIPPKQP